MSHELLWKALDAQRANATLSGRELRSAAERLRQVRRPNRTLLMSFDAAGERIIGAAMTLGDDDIEVFDYTSAFPAEATCLLVGGFVAGPVGMASAADAAVEAGARRVEVAMLGGWSSPIDCVDRVWQLAGQHAHVA